MRASLSRRDAASAAQRLKTLSELRGSWSMKAAATLGLAWPDLLQRAYDFRRTLKAS